MPTPRELTRPLEQALDPRALAGLRLDRLRDLVRSFPQDLELDPNGAPVVRGEVVASGLSEAAIGQAQAAGFQVLRREQLEGLDLSLTVLAPPAGMSAREAVRRLEARLGVGLLNRTTRSVTPTEAGARLLDRLAPALGEVRAALGTLAEANGPAGTLRLNVPGVVALEQCRTRKMGLEYYVDLHVEVDGEITVREGHLIAHAVKDAVLAAIPSVADVLVHVEPAGGYQPE